MAPFLTIPNTTFHIDEVFGGFSLWQKKVSWISGGRSSAKQELCVTCLRNLSGGAWSDFIGTEA